MNRIGRRRFLNRTLSAGSVAASANLLSASEKRTPSEAAQAKHPRGKADHCIFIWLGGGACHIDTWDPKRKGDPKSKKPGSYYDPIATSIPGVQLCQHLPLCAQLLDRFAVIRSIHHEVIDEHAAATNRVHTGRPTSGTIVYPSIGSIVAHERGTAHEGVPAYTLIGYPNVTRGPGFLGAKANFIYLTDTKSGPAGLVRPRDVTVARRVRREKLLNRLRQSYRAANSKDAAIRAYDETTSQALKLSGPEFMRVFELDKEPDTLRNSYGGEFGQRCLLARRLVESGVRFVEVSHNLNFVNGTGWDTHNDGQLKQHLLIQELDTALAGLIKDLESKKLLDRTLIALGTEFGRPAAFDGGGGRGHHAKAFSLILAGGGLKTGTVVGETDELGMKIVSEPVSIPDYHATIHCAMGIDPDRVLYAGDRPVPIVDMGKPIRRLFS